MSYIEALILGIVQGLTEFLPVSSSGHILVFETFFGIDTSSDGMMLLSVLLHLGTLLSVCVVYWRRILDMLLHPWKSDLKYLVVATIPAVIAALAVDFDAAFEGAFLCWSFYLTTVVLLLGEWIHARRVDARSLHKKVRLTDAVVMGLMQAVAILPGLSRSGSTISAGSASGLTRKRAADFAFLMSIPAILGSCVLEVWDYIQYRPALEVGGAQIAISVAASAVFGFLAIKGMLKLIKKVSLRWFALYTFLLGTFVLLDKYLLHIFNWA